MKVAQADEVTSRSISVEICRISGEGGKCAYMLDAELFEGEWVHLWSMRECQFARDGVSSLGSTVGQGRYRLINRYEVRWGSLSHTLNDGTRAGMVRLNVPLKCLSGFETRSFVQSELKSAIYELA